MTVRVGINGFGRIGRSILRSLLQSDARDIDVVAINDPAPGETLAHLLEFDSLHGPLGYEVHHEDDVLSVGKAAIRLSHESAPDKLKWHDVDIALECSGRFASSDLAARHFANGSRRILLSAPSKDRMKTVAYGVNQVSIDVTDTMVSNASCTTNCLAPVAKILHDAFGIERGMMTTVHSYTSTQNTHDAPHEDLYRARAAALSMIPTTTGAADFLGAIIPELEGRITGHAIRVPTPNVSCVDLVVNLERKATAQDINDCFADAAGAAYRGIVATTNRKLVSADFRQNPHSAILACDQTRAQGNMARILAWYDNEWGFAHRMIDVTRYMASL